MIWFLSFLLSIFQRLGSLLVSHLCTRCISFRKIALSFTFRFHLHSKARTQKNNKRKCVVLLDAYKDLLRLCDSVPQLVLIFSTPLTNNLLRPLSAHNPDLLSRRFFIGGYVDSKYHPPFWYGAVQCKLNSYSSCSSEWVRISLKTLWWRNISCEKRAGNSAKEAQVLDKSAVIYIGQNRMKRGW